MATRPIAILLTALGLGFGTAQACQIVVQITLEFPENSATLDKSQVARLANWLAEVRGWYRYGDADVEGMASNTSPEGKTLAKRRAEVTTHALRSLHGALPIHTAAHIYAPADVRSNGNLAAVQLNPLDPPDCSPARDHK